MTVEPFAVLPFTLTNASEGAVIVISCIVPWEIAPQLIVVMIKRNNMTLLKNLFIFSSPFFTVLLSL